MQDKIAILIKRIGLECDKLSSHILEPYNLTPTQFRILKLLLLNPPCSLRQVDVEQLFGIRNPTVTGILQNLEKKGLIERRTNPQDSRSKVICLTEKALAMEALLYQLGSQVEETLTRNLDAKDKKQLTKLLKKMMGQAEQSGNGENNDV